MYLPAGCPSAGVPFATDLLDWVLPHCRLETWTGALGHRMLASQKAAAGLPNAHAQRLPTHQLLALHFTPGRHPPSCQSRLVVVGWLVGRSAACSNKFCRRAHVTLTWPPPRRGSTCGRTCSCHSRCRCARRVRLSPSDTTNTRSTQRSEALAHSWTVLDSADPASSC